MRTSPIKALLFDFDGTLVDATRAISVSFQAALSGAGHAEFPAGALPRMIGRPLTEMFQKAVPEADADHIRELIDAYRLHFHPLSASHSRPLPGTRLIAAHFSRSHRLAIATSRTSDGAIRMLTAHGLGYYFEAVVGLEQVSRPKPHPEALYKALECLGCAPEEAVMVGDTPDDMAAGRRAGLIAIGVTSGAHDVSALRDAGADFVIDRICRLIDLISMLNGGSLSRPPDDAAPSARHNERFVRS